MFRTRDKRTKVARNKRLSVDDSDLERTERTITKGALTEEKRGKKSGRVEGTCVRARTRPAKRDIRNLFRSGTARFSTLTRPSR